MNSRILLSLCALTAGLAAAQPANDSCVGALPITPPSGYAFSRSSVSLMLDAGITPEKPFSCGATAAQTAWYTFTPSVTGRYQLQTTLAEAPGGNVTNTVLAIYEGTCAALTEVPFGCDNDFTGTNAQSRVLPTLTAGTTYFVQVGKIGAAAASDALQVTVNQNLAAENCAGPITNIPLNTTIPISLSAQPDAGGVGTNDSQLSSMTCYVGTGNTTSTAPAFWPGVGKDVVLSFTPPRDGLYSFRIGATGLNTRGAESAIYLTDSCTEAMVPPQLWSPPQCIAAANRAGNGVINPEELSCIQLTGGTDVFVWIDEGSTSPIQGASFPLEVTECQRELEPNNTAATATALQCPLTAGIVPSGDVDYFDLGVAPANARLFSMIEAGAANFNMGTQSSTANLQLRVTTGTDTVEFDNDDLDNPFNGSAPGVAGTPLDAGVQHFLRVNNLSGAVEPYRVYAVIQASTPATESEPNGTPDEAQGSIENYFSGTISAATDVDFFAFEATAGEVVYLALDSLPSRTGNTNATNLSLELWGLDGKRIGVNDATVAVNSTVTVNIADAGTPTSPSEHLVYRVPTTGQYFARVGGATITTNNTYLLSIAKNCSTGNGMRGPTLTALVPVSGALPGGDTITLTGTNFGFAPKVTFGGSAAQVVSNTATSLVVINPLGAEGPADVVVKTAAGSATLAGGFEYLSPIVPPTVTSISPLEGSIAGGLTVTINGTFFKPGAEVSFDVGGVIVPATNVQIVNINRLTATTPAHAEGDATIIVRNPVDNLQGSLPDAFRYNDAPRITGVSPNVGLTTGGQTLTLTGTSFRGGATVRFGATLATNVTVTSGTSLTLTTPSAAASGPVDLTITNTTDGQSSVLDDGFSFVYPAPTISAVNPNRGPASGGTAITITGTFFLPAPTVLVGGVAATAVVRVNATTITARTPAGTGAADVAVANFDGQAVTSAGAFTYEPPPSLTAITPVHGPIRGGTRITVTGQNFKPGVRLLIGGSPAMSVILTGDTTLTGLTPSGPGGPADVETINPDGQRAVLTDGFSWDAAPVISGLTPVTGSVQGGTVVTVTGRNFFAGAEVLFGTQSATNVTVNSATELTAVAPPRAVGVVSLTVRNTDGQQVEKPSAFRYVLSPMLTEISPATGDLSGGTVTRLTGAGFGAQTTVSFGGVPSPLVTLIDSTHLDAVTPAHALGVVNVIVANADGAAAALTDAFTFTRGAPEVISVAPLSGDISGGSLITVVGSGFAEGVTVSIGGNDATDVVLVSSELLRAVVPAHAAGPVDVTVTNDDAQSATAIRAFSYVTQPDGQQGLVADGGAVGLGAPPEPQTPWTPPSGCGCSSVEGSVIAFAALGMLLRRRSRR